MSYNPNSGGNGGGGALSFLFNGSPPPSTSSYNQQSSQLPKYYTDYAQNMLHVANNWASQPYPTYTGPRVAALNQDQQNAYGQVRDASQAYNGYAGAGAGAIGMSIDPSHSGLNAASPYLNEANQGIAGQMGQFFNPYTQASNQNLADNMAHNYQTNILPGLANQFAAAGQLAGPGSTRMGDMQNEAARNEQQALSQGITANNLGAFSGAMQGAGAQANLQANLASTAGGLQQNANSLGVNAGTALANVGQTGQNTALGGASALNAIGQQQQGQTQKNLDTAYSDFQNQFNWPMTGVNAEHSILSGMQVPAAQQQYSYGINPQATQPGFFSPSGLNQLQNIFAPGAVKQATGPNGQG
jgi:hypothetical protein